jgi:hypothetical protein
MHSYIRLVLARRILSFEQAPAAAKELISLIQVFYQNLSIGLVLHFIIWKYLQGHKNYHLSSVLCFLLDTAVLSDRLTYWLHEAAYFLERLTLLFSSKFFKFFLKTLKQTSVKCENAMLYFISFQKI